MKVFKLSLLAAAVIVFCTPFNIYAKDLIAMPSMGGAASDFDKHICRNMTIRLRAAKTKEDKLAMVRDHKFTDGKIFKNPIWTEIDPKENIDAIKAIYTVERASHGLEEQEAAWQQSKVEVLKNLADGLYKIESTQIPIHFNSQQKAIIFKITKLHDPRLPSEEDVVHIKYVVHQSDDNSEVKDWGIATLSDFDSEFLLFEGIGLFTGVMAPYDIGISYIIPMQEQHYYMPKYVCETNRDGKQ